MKAVKCDKRRYKRRNRVEIMFGSLKDWRRVATRYDRCPKIFLSAIALAATVPFTRIPLKNSFLIGSTVDLSRFHAAQSARLAVRSVVLFHGFNPSSILEPPENPVRFNCCVQNSCAGQSLLGCSVRASRESNTHLE